VTSYDTPYPPASMETAWLPNAARVVNAARKIVNA
jgi:pyruvate/2-oxoglutarate/acetoin dehydrogenase E1 component